MSSLAVLALVLAAVGPALAADAAYDRGARPGTGATAVATSPPAADGEPSAMPRTTAQRLRSVRPEVIVGVLVGLMLLTAAVLAVRMVLGAFRHR